MRIALFADIHSNLPALDAVLTAAGSVDAIWQMGDVVGYGPDPDAVVARLAAVGAIGVRGNHDSATLGGREIDSFNPDARRAIEWTRSVIGPEARAWLAALPERLTIGDFTLVHGSQRDPTWEYVFSGPAARASLLALDSRHGCNGHTHVAAAFRLVGERVEAIDPGRSPIVQLDERPTLINPGSVGQPRDGDPRASWALLDTDAWTCTWHRAAYDVARVQSAMTAAHLPRGLITRLAMGA